MPYDGRALANLLLDLADVRSMPLTNMTIQKLLYYAHGWHLAASGIALVEDGFEAWPHGPVSRVVYNAFKRAGDRPIRARAEAMDIVTGCTSVALCSPTEEESRLLVNVLDALGHLHAFELSRMTHERGSPWDQIWNATSGRVTPGMHIPDQLIRTEFLKSRSQRLN